MMHSENPMVALGYYQGATRGSSESAAERSLLGKCSLQQILLAGLRVNDLVDDHCYSVLRYDVRHTISHLNGYNSLGCRKIELNVHRLITGMTCGSQAPMLPIQLLIYWRSIPHRYIKPKS